MTSEQDVTGQPTVFVIRHGETEWSMTGRHTGRTDLPLTSRGEQQARDVAPLLDAESLGLVLCSPLDRAQQTCRLAGLRGRAELDDDLLEWDYGDMEGRTTADIRTSLPDWTVWDAPMPGGETLEEVAARADRIVARCRESDGNVALFAHGHILRITIARWCELDAAEGRRFPLDTATVTELGWEHQYPTLQVLNRR